MNSNAIVTLADSNYFELLIELINSINTHDKNKSVSICVLDAGLTAKQNKIIKDKVYSIKKANLVSPQWLRSIKSKKYPFWRLDTLFSKTKYQDVFFIKNGGWHFSNLKNPAEIENKLKSYLHHRDFEVENIDLKEISRLMRNNETIYDMYADKTENKITEKKRKLSLYPKGKLPQYVQNHESKFKDWLD